MESVEKNQVTDGVVSEILTVPVPDLDLTWFDRDVGSRGQSGRNNNKISVNIYVPLAWSIRSNEQIQSIWRIRPLSPKWLAFPFHFYPNGWTRMQTWGWYKTQNSQNLFDLFDWMDPDNPFDWVGWFSLFGIQLVGTDWWNRDLDLSIWSNIFIKMIYEIRLATFAVYTNWNNSHKHAYGHAKRTTK